MCKHILNVQVQPRLLEQQKTLTTVSTQEPELESLAELCLKDERSHKAKMLLHRCVSWLAP